MHTTNTVQFSEEREKIVMDFLQNQGSIRVGDVTDLVGISPSTARLLLQKMQDKGLLKRTHGGAILNEMEEESEQKDSRNYSDIINIEKKRKVAAAAVATVKDGDYICIGSGTTTFLMATMLHDKQDLTVVTDSIPVAYELLNKKGITLYVSGGWIMPRDSACRGLIAENFFKDIRVDKSYNGADSIDIELGVTSVDFDPRTERAVCHSGKQCYILVDSTKFTTRPYIDKVVHIQDIDCIFTDDSIDQKYVESLQKSGVKVVIGK